MKITAICTNIVQLISLLYAIALLEKASEQLVYTCILESFPRVIRHIKNQYLSIDVYRINDIWKLGRYFMNKSLLPRVNNLRKENALPEAKDIMLDVWPAKFLYIKSKINRHRNEKRK